MEKNKCKPFGLRVFIEKIDNPLTNLGKDIYEGIIVEIPTKKSINSSLIINSLSTNYQSLNDLNYDELFGNYGILSTNTKVRFKYNPEIVDNDGNIYNVPIELIRAYGNE